MDSKRKALIESVDTNLSACAHCGSRNVAIRRTVEDGSVFWHAECLNCGICTKKFEEIGDNNKTVVTPTHAVCAMLDAINYACDIWNTRYADLHTVWTPSISPRENEEWTYIAPDGAKYSNKPKHGKKGKKK